MTYYRPTSFPKEAVRGVLFPRFRILSDEVGEEQEGARISWERNTKSLKFGLISLVCN